MDSQQDSWNHSILSMARLDPLLQSLDKETPTGAVEQGRPEPAGRAAVPGAGPPADLECVSVAL